MNETPRLKSLLLAYIRRYRRNRMLFGLGLAGLVLLLPLPVVCLLDRFILLSDAFRITLWAIYMLGGVLVIAGWIAPVLLRRFSLLQAAHSLNDQHPELKESLAAALQLSTADKEKQAWVSPHLIGAAREEGERRAGELDPRKILPSHRSWKMAGWGLAALLLQLPFLLMPNLQYPDLLKRFFNPFGNYGRVSGVQVVVTPGSLDVGDGETVRVEAQVSDPELARLGLFRMAEGGEPVRFEMTRAAPGKFRFPLPNLRRDLAYYLADGLIRTPDFEVRVLRRPRLERFSVSYEFPKYTGLKSRTEERRDGNLEAFNGTRVTLRIELDTDVRRVALRTLEGDKHQDTAMERVDERTATLTFPLEKTFRYQIVAESKRRGLPNLNRMTWTATALADKPPRVMIKTSARKVRRGARSAETIRFEARDEFAIREARMVIRRAGRGDEVRTVEARGIGETRIQGSGTVSLAEIKALPGEVVSVSVQARDVLDQWGSSPAYLIEIPVASGAPLAVRIANDIEPVRKALAQLGRQLRSSSMSFDRIKSMLAKIPDKWTLQLESATSQLRPSMEALRQKASLTAGVAVQQREAVQDRNTEAELQPVSTLATDLDLALRRMDLEMTLTEIRQGFQEDGPAIAARVADDIRKWNAPVSSAGQLLTTYERHLRVRDLRTQAQQLFEAQQGILVESQTGEHAAARILNLQRIILDETALLLVRLEDVARIPPKAERLRGGGFKTLSNAAAAFADQLKMSSDVPMDRAVEFAPHIENVLRHLQKEEGAYAGAVSRYRQQLAEARIQQVSVATLIMVLNDAIERVTERIEEDPLDKEDELEILPPLVSDLRRMLENLRNTAGELWTRADGQAGSEGRPLWRRDLIWLADRLYRLDRNEGQTIRAGCAAIAATFEQKREATPLLKNIRPPIAGLKNQFGNLYQVALALDEEQRLHDWATRIRIDLAAGRSPVPPKRSRKSKKAGPQPPFRTIDPEVTKLVTEVLKRLTAQPIPTWHRLEQALTKGSPSAAKARTALAQTQETRRTEFRRLATEWKAWAERVRNQRSLLEAIKDKPTISLTEHLSATIGAGREVLGDLSGLLSCLNAEPACRLTEKEGHTALRYRTAWMALWAVHQEAALPSVVALEACAGVPGLSEKRALFDQANTFADDATRRLSDLADAVSDPPGSGAAWLNAFEKNRELSEALAQRSRDVGELLALSRQALTSGDRTLTSKPNTEELQASLNQLTNATLPFGSRSREAGIRELEGAVQQLSALSMEQEELGRKIAGLKASEKAVQASYQELAKSLPSELERLTTDLSNAQQTAKDYGGNVRDAIQAMLAAVKKAGGPARSFADAPTMPNGKKLSGALQVRNDLSSMDRWLDARIAVQALGIDDAKLLLELKPVWPAVLVKLEDLQKRYDAESVKRNKEYDALVDAGREAVGLVETEEQMILYMKYSRGASETKTNEELARTFMSRNGWGGTESIRSPLWPVIGKTTDGFTSGGKRMWTAKVGHGKMLTFAYHWGLVASRIKIFAARFENYIAKASTSAPEDVEKLKTFKAKCLKAVSLIEARLKTAEACGTYEGWRKTRRDYAREIGTVEDSMTGAVDRLVERAKAGERQLPRKLSLSSGKGKAPSWKVDPSLPAMAKMALMLKDSLSRTRRYTLLGGEDDPNLDLQRAHAIQRQIPPSGILADNTRMASAGCKLSDDLLKKLGSASNLEKGLRAFKAGRDALSQVTKRFANLRSREPALRAAVQASSSGADVLKSRFVSLQDQSVRQLTEIQSRLDLLLGTASFLKQEAKCRIDVQETAKTLAGPNWAAQAEKAKSSLGTGRPEEAAQCAATVGSALDREAKRLRAAVERLREQSKTGAGSTSSDTGTRLANATARTMVNETLRRLVRARTQPNADASAGQVAFEILLASRRLRRAAELEIDAMGKGWAESVGRDRLLALLKRAGQRTIEGEEHVVEDESPAAETQVIGSLKLRPAGRDPRGAGYGKLSSRLQRNLSAASLERRPPEIEAAWRRYLEVLRSPPRPRVFKTPSSGGNR